MKTVTHGIIGGASRPLVAEVQIARDLLGVERARPDALDDPLGQGLVHREFEVAPELRMASDHHGEIVRAVDVETREQAVGATENTAECLT